MDNLCIHHSRYAGILLGITNTFATIPGMVGPVIARALTSHVRNTCTLTPSLTSLHSGFDSVAVLCQLLLKPQTVSV